jgi:zinc protease
LARLTRRDVVDFYNKYVVGGNTVLAVFGDIDVEKTKALIEKAFASMKPGKAVPPALKPAPKLSAGKDVIKFVKPTKRGQVNLVLGTNGVAIGDDDQYAMSVLSIMLGRKLHEALRGRNDYVYLVFASNVPGFGTGTFYIIAQTTPDKYDKMMEEIWVELNAFMKGEFSDEDLDSARRGAVSYSEIGMQKNSDVAGAAALDELYGMGYDYYLKYPSKVAKVSREDILKVAKKYFVRWLLVETRPEGSNG